MVFPQGAAAHFFASADPELLQQAIYNGNNLLCSFCKLSGSRHNVMEPLVISCIKVTLPKASLKKNT